TNQYGKPYDVKYYCSLADSGHYFKGEKECSDVRKGVHHHHHHHHHHHRRRRRRQEMKRQMNMKLHVVFVMLNRVILFLESSETRYTAWERGRSSTMKIVLELRVRRDSFVEGVH
ncbi:hypothetical protein ANN_03116, partial [Periplaneta americana]